MNDVPEPGEHGDVGGRGPGARHVWSSSAYPGMAPNLLPAIARLVEFAGVDEGDLLLDAACGTGNVALTARRAGASVVGLDLAGGMLGRARENASVLGTDDRDADGHGADGLAWVRGDVARLPLADGAVDATLSSFGHVFAPDAGATGRELVRATRPGGRLAFAAWSPHGVVGALAKLAAEYLPEERYDPTAHLRWGDPRSVEALLEGVTDLEFRHGEVTFRYVSPAHFWRQVGEESGPLVAAVEQLDDAEAREAMRDEALDRVEEFFGGNEVRAEYLLVRGTVE